MNVFRSEWVKLSRPGILLGGLGSMVGAVLLASFGIFRIASLQQERIGQAGGAGGGPGGRGGGGAGFRTMAEFVADASGWVAGVRGASSLLGIVALVLFASNVGGEYKQGTLRSLLAGEPRRLRLLAGKVAALSSLVALAVAASVVAGLVAAFGFGALFGIDSSAWLSGEGLLAGAQAFVNLTFACVGWGILGAFLALVLRTSAAAIGIGVGYLLVAETLLARAVVAPVFDAEAAWFPGEVLRIFASGGGPGSSYVRAGLLAALYVTVFAAVAATAFTRRDVVQ